MNITYVWVFNGQNGRFPGGIFSTLEIAESWISANAVTGVLTRYPLDVGSYDWACENGLVNDNLAAKMDRDKIGSFSSASFEHFHYEAGRRE